GAASRAKTKETVMPSNDARIPKTKVRGFMIELPQVRCRHAPNCLTVRMQTPSSSRSSCPPQSSRSWRPRPRLCRGGRLSSPVVGVFALGVSVVDDQAQMRWLADGRVLEHFEIAVQDGFEGLAVLPLGMLGGGRLDAVERE